MSTEHEQHAEPEEILTPDDGVEEDEASSEEAARLAHLAQLTAKMRNGANWFFWIAGLSIANTVILLMEGDRHFVVGLGITQLINAVALAFAQQAPETAMVGKVVAFVITLLASAVVAAFGFGARRGMTWLFIVGMGLYFLDGLLFILFQDWMSVGFHLFALWCMSGGLRASWELNALDRGVVTAQAD
jgi:hypothetical protein